MTAQPLISSTTLMRVMTVFLFVLIQKRVMAPFTDNILGLMRVTLLSFGTREYLNKSTPGEMTAENSYHAKIP